jgi:fatty acid amide hydrolase 2
LKGVTNISEIAMWMESYNYLYGITNNPYDLTRTVGGSSGGEAATIGISNINNSKLWCTVWHWI